MLYLLLTNLGRMDLFHLILFFQINRLMVNYTLFYVCLLYCKCSQSGTKYLLYVFFLGLLPASKIVGSGLRLYHGQQPTTGNYLFC